ncbi:MULTISPECIES: ETX/MTX2 family pore-forming toxin [Lysobacter]|uniref:ETX/MTX2 family pore-forming toxin n=1 Tax=Lysobacter yananisis TaxID=1003114 RepID=A0ABY9PA14_9GAMM|nr:MULTISPECIES: ETX/MTX2 family pore-forming toxin [Lysobacter]QQQ00637.1 ETX/MTX2 family pore-forming toxin [Lysobacter enzymogenes]UZW60082.1 ETX/MTX2 family pore-forming toxin [Lysobacter enzymogenes]WMT03920.1 ETX/MTX2 family pore-forming toxin [Lysobacter yananisis]
MDVNMIDFLEGWARQWAGERGGANNYDWDGTNPIFRKYADRYGVNLDWSLGDYAIQSKSTKAVSVYSAEYGPFDTRSDITFSHTYDETDSFEWSVTETVGVSQTTSVSVGVPDLFSADASLTLDLSVSTTQSQQKQRTNSWSLTRNFELEPHTVATMEMVLNQTTATAVADLRGVMSGRIAIGLNNRWNGHYFWFVPVADLARQFNARNDITVIGGNVEVRVPVKFHGVGVIDTYLREKTRDPSGRIETRLHDGLDPPIAMPEAA